MKILVMGSTGGTGREVVECALRAGHEVTAFARSAARVTSSHERLRVVEGDVLRPETVANAVRGQDAVICAIGPSDQKNPGTVISTGVRSIVAAMGQTNVRRLVFESGLMVGDCRGMNVFKRSLIGMFRLWYRQLYDDKVLAEKLVVDSGLDWLIVRPPTLKHIPSKGKYRVGTDMNVDVIAGLSHGDVADFMVKSAADSSHFRQTLDISY
jgi:putative NADH-flavin reductase